VAAAEGMGRGPTVGQGMVGREGGHQRQGKKGIGEKNMSEKEGDEESKTTVGNSLAREGERNF